MILRSFVTFSKLLINNIIYKLRRLSPNIAENVDFDISIARFTMGLSKMSFQNQI